jgi:integrase
MARRSDATREYDKRFPGTFTDAWVRATRGFEREVQYAERLKKGLSLVLYVSAAPHETKTWRVLFYDNGRARSKRIGTYPTMTVKAAREHAYDEFDPDHAIASAKAGTFREVSDEWLADHVVKKGLRSKGEIERQLRTYILPAWGKRPMFEIERADVNKLLRDIEKKHGAPQADAVLATVRSIMTWYAVENDKYTPKVVPKMKRDKREVGEKARKRILSKDEIRAVWQACDDFPVYGDLVRMLLLTGQRLRKVSAMRHSDIAETHEVELKRGDKTVPVAFDNVWIVPTEPREKGNIGAVALPALAVQIIERQPVIAKNPHIFPAAHGKGPINSFSQCKADLDAKVRELLPTIKPWVVHDLRRTARSLLSELRTDTDIAERVIGHRIVGVRGVYDRFDFFEQKTEILERLAAFITTILIPPAANVVPLRVNTPSTA